MSKVKFLTLLSVTLVLINIVLIGFFLLRRPHRKMIDGPKMYIFNQLNLDEKQVAQYDSFVVEHQIKRNTLNEKIMGLRKELYPVVLKDGNISKKDQILVQLSAAHQDLELLHLRHFEQLKEICRIDQRKQFDVLVDELTHLFATKGQEKED